MKDNGVQFKEICRDLKIPMDCPGINWRNGSDGDFDMEILPLLKKLNALTYCHTTGSCAGHSVREIKNGKGLFGDPYLINLTLHVGINHLDEFKQILLSMFDVSSGRFWCEFGYQEDYNCKTEKGYIPLVIKVFCKTKRVRDKLLLKYEAILDGVMT